MRNLVSCLCEQRLVKPDNYSALDRPARPTIVEVIYEMMDLEGIDETDKEFRAHFWLSVRWIDPRLAGYYPKRDKCSKMAVKLEKGNFNDIWLPNIRLVRSSFNIYESFDKIPVAIYNNGLVETWMHVNARIGCPMDFTRLVHALGSIITMPRDTLETLR